MRRLLFLLCLLPTIALAGWPSSGQFYPPVSGVTAAQGSNFLTQTYTGNCTTFTGCYTFARAGQATMYDSTGTLTYGPNQVFLNSASGLAVLGTQNITVNGITHYVLYCVSSSGTGVVTATGAGYSSGGPLICGSSGSSAVIITSAAGGTLTLTGSVATVS